MALTFRSSARLTLWAVRYGPVPCHCEGAERPKQSPEWLVEIASPPLAARNDRVSFS